jgi:hypothetical protein
VTWSARDRASCFHQWIDIVFDRESQFVSNVWKFVCQTLKINVKLSIAFHSEIDEQNEIANQKMKRYLRNYCNYQQDDWSKWLSMTEFAFNVATFTFIELFVFMTNYDFDSMTIKKLIKERILNKKASDIIEKMKSIWKFIKEKLVNAQKSQKKYANRKRIISLNYAVEDIVWLFTKNIKTERSFRKLNHKWIDSYRIKKVIKNACQLDLSQSMKIHDTFHISLLRSASNDSLIEQIQSSSSSIVIDEKEEYEMNDVLDSRYHYDKLQYKIVWTYHSSDRAWYSAENFQNHSKNILNDYHQRYSAKLESKLRLIVIIEAMLSQWIRNEHKEAKQLIQNVLNKMKAEMKENRRKRFNKDSSATNVLAREESWLNHY